MFFRLITGVVYWWFPLVFCDVNVPQITPTP